MGSGCQRQWQNLDKKISFLLLSPRLIQRRLLTKVLKESSLLHPQNTMTTQQIGLVYRRF